MAPRRAPAKSFHPDTGQNARRTLLRSAPLCISPHLPAPAQTSRVGCRGAARLGAQIGNGACAKESCDSSYPLRARPARFGTIHTGCARCAIPARPHIWAARRPTVLDEAPGNAIHPILVANHIDMHTVPPSILIVHSAIPQVTVF